jgi:hypothetical protein
MYRTRGKMPAKKMRDTLTEADKSSAFADLRASLLKTPENIPDEYPLRALYIGKPSTGKSGAALEITKELKEGEMVVMVDIDEGNDPNAFIYHKQDCWDKKLKIEKAIVWDSVLLADGTTDYSLNHAATLDKVKHIGEGLLALHKELNIKAVILDGLSTLLRSAEYQNPTDEHLNDKGDLNQKYWADRGKAFDNIIQLYKSIPVDVFFIGNVNFETDPKKDIAKVINDVSDMAYQIVNFSVVETADGKVQYYAKINKSKQNFKSRGRKIKFAETDSEHPDADYKWNPLEIIEALRPEKNE